MQQQKQQLPETEDWQVRLAKNMIQMDWKESDPVFVNLPLEEVLLFLFTQSQQDRHQQQQRRHLYLFGVLSPLLVAYWLLIKNQTFFILLPVLASVFLSLNYLANTRVRIERDRTTPQAGAVFRVTKALGLNLAAEIEVRGGRHAGDRNDLLQ